MVTVGVFGILVAISEENKSTRKVFSSKAERYQELEGLKERRRKFGKKEVRPTFHFPLCELPCVTHFFSDGVQLHSDWMKRKVTWLILTSLHNQGADLSADSHDDKRQ